MTNYKLQHGVNWLKFFDENAVRAMAELVVIALVALSVKQYRGNLFLLYYEEYKYIYILLFS